MGKLRMDSKTFCSMSCAGKNRLEERRANFRKVLESRPEKVQVECEGCGTLFWSATRFGKARLRFCTIPCRAKWQVRVFGDRRFTKEALAKRSLTRRGCCYMTQEQIDAHATKLRGKPNPKVAAALKGRTLTEIAKRHCSEGQLRRWKLIKASPNYKLSPHLLPMLRENLIRTRSPEHRTLSAALGVKEESLDVLIHLSETERVFVDILLPNRYIVEVDGATHTRPKEREKDRQRDAKLKTLGYYVLRVWNWDVRERLDEVVKQIQQCMTSKSPMPIISSLTESLSTTAWSGV